MALDTEIRLKVVNAMIKVVRKFKEPQSMVLHAIRIFDLYYVYLSSLKLTGDESLFTDSNYILTGLASVMIAQKESNNSSKNLLPISFFKDELLNCKKSNAELLDKELEIMQVTCLRIGVPSHFETYELILSMLLCNFQKQRISQQMITIVNEMKEVIENLILQIAIYMPAFQRGTSIFEIVTGIIDCSLRTLHFNQSKTGNKELLKEIISFSSIWLEVLAKIGLSAKYAENYGEMIYNEIIKLHNFRKELKTKDLEPALNS
jgi:hypothetical protein